MSSSTQVIFSRAVQHHISDAYVSLLDRINQFEIGAVLTYHEKPRFWRRAKFDFTGAQLSNLLADDESTDHGGVAASPSSFSFNSEKNRLMDEATDSSQRKVDLHLDLDGELEMAFATVGLDVKGAGKRSVKINVSLGSIDHITSNMFDALVSGNLKANLQHPIVHEAINNGKALFVISSVYQSQEIDISIDRSEFMKSHAKQHLGLDDTDSGGKGGKDSRISKAAAIEKAIVGGINVSGHESVSGDAKLVSTGQIITKRNEPSNIGFSALKITIGADGSLIPQAKTGIPYDRHKIHASYGDAFASFSTSNSTSGAAATRDE